MSATFALFLIAITLINAINTKKHYIPLIHLGEVSLNDVANCERLLSRPRLKCEAMYQHSVNETIHRHNMDTSTESVRRAVCCGAWKARDCVANAAVSIKECGQDVANRYLTQPSSAYIKEEMADMCSEYDEFAPICSNASSLYVTVLNLIVVNILRIIINL